MCEILREINETRKARKTNALLDEQRQKRGGMRAMFGKPQIFNSRRREHRAFLFFVVMDLEPRPMKPGEEGKLTVYDPVAAKRNRFPPMDKAFLGLYKSEWDGKAGIWKGNVDKKTKQPLYKPVTLWSEYQSLSTLRGLFVRKIWNEYVRPNAPHPDCVDGRTRSTFDYAVTMTLRGVSYRPNGQQITRGDTPVQKDVKNLYIPDEFKVILVMDFMAVEVRWGCICSGDKALADLLWRGKEALDAYRRNPTPKNKRKADIANDVHKQTTGLVFCIQNIYAYDWDTPEAKHQRNVTKTIIFGVFFGRGKRAIAMLLGISEDEAGTLIEQIRAQFPRLFEYLEDCAYTAARCGFVSSPFGHRRRLHYAFKYESRMQGLRDEGVWDDEEVASALDISPAEVRAYRKGAADAKRQAKNFSIQGTASIANNIGAFEYLTEIEPELRPLSPLAQIEPETYLHPDYVEFAHRAAATKQALMCTSDPWRTDSLRRELRGLNERYLASCRARALEAALHNLVHDSVVQSCQIDDLPRIVDLMEDCFTQRVTTIAEKGFGIKMIAPLGIDIEIGSGYGRTEKWDFTEAHLARLMETARQEIPEREAARQTQPLVARSAAFAPIG